MLASNSQSPPSSVPSAGIKGVSHPYQSKAPGLFAFIVVCFGFGFRLGLSVGSAESTDGFLNCEVHYRVI